MNHSRCFYCGRTVVLCICLRQLTAEQAVEQLRLERDHWRRHADELAKEADAWKASAEGGDAEEKRLEDENDALRAELSRLRAIAEAALLRARQDHIAIYEGEAVTGVVERIDLARALLADASMKSQRLDKDR